VKNIKLPGKSSHFGFKLTFSYMALVLIAVIIMGYSSYKLSINSLIDRSKADISGTIQQMSDNIKYNLNVVQRMAKQIVTDTKLSTSITGAIDPALTYEDYSQYIKPKLEMALLMSESPTKIISNPASSAKDAVGKS